MAFGQINEVVLMGNLGKDPEIRRSQTGIPVCSLNVATSESWVDKQSGERKEVVEWHRVVVFGKADSPGLVGMIEKYLTKGDKIYLRGQLKTRKWQDKDGADKYTTEIVLRGFNDAFQIISSKTMEKNKKDSGGGPPLDTTPGREAYAASPGGSPKTNGFPDDDIPF